MIRRGPVEPFGNKSCWYAPEGLDDASTEDLDAIEALMKDDPDVGPLVFPPQCLGALT